MERSHTPAKTRQARTVFRLTPKEVAESLAAWVSLNGESVPEGEQFVWLSDASRREDEWFVTLVVDHDRRPDDGEER